MYDKIMKKLVIQLYFVEELSKIQIIKYLRITRPTLNKLLQEIYIDISNKK